MRNKTVELGICALLIALLLLEAVTAKADPEAYYVLCHPASELNVRLKPSVKGRKIGGYGAGDLVMVDKIRRGWARDADANMRFDAWDGWMAAAYLVDSPVDVYAEGIGATVTAKGRVKIRATPGGSRVGWLRDGDAVTVFAVSDVWTVTGKGYVKTDCLVFNEAE